PAAERIRELRQKGWTFVLSREEGGTSGECHAEGHVMTSEVGTLSADEQKLAELGYKQELRRGWSAFSNFAISFSIISILAGCFTSYGQAFLNGGPVAISIGWPVISCLILCVAFSMAELASAMLTAAASITGRPSSVA